jgi:hypothetical protein
MMIFVDILYDIDFLLRFRRTFQASIERSNGDGSVPYGGDGMAFLGYDLPPEVGGKVTR